MVRVACAAALPLFFLSGCRWFIDGDAPALTVTVDQVTMTIEVSDSSRVRTVQVLLSGVGREVFEPGEDVATLTHGLDDVRPGAYELSVIATDRYRNERVWRETWESPTHLFERTVVGSASETVEHEVEPGDVAVVATVELETSAVLYSARFGAPPRAPDGHEHRWRVTNPSSRQLAGIELELIARDAADAVVWIDSPMVGDLGPDDVAESGVVDESPVAIASFDLVFRGYVERRSTLGGSTMTVEHEQSAGVFVDVVEVNAWHTALTYDPIAGSPARGPQAHEHEFSVRNRFGATLAPVSVGVTARDGLGNVIWSDSVQSGAVPLEAGERLLSDVVSTSPSVPSSYDVTFTGYTRLRSLLGDYRETVYDGSIAIGSVLAEHTAFTYTPLAGSPARTTDGHRHDLRFDYTGSREIVDVSLLVRARSGATTLWNAEVTRDRVSPQTSVVAESVATGSVTPGAYDVTLEAYERYPSTVLDYDDVEFTWSNGLITLSLEVWHRATTFVPVADAASRAPEDHEQYYRLTNLSPYTLSGANPRVRAYYRGSLYWEHSMSIATFAPGDEVVSPVVSTVSDSPYSYQMWLTWTGLSGANQ